MSVSKNRVFGSLLSLMVGTAVISLAGTPVFAADNNIPVQNVAPLKAAPVSSRQQEALADASDVSELRAQLIKKEKELEELKHSLSLQRKQIENATLYKDAQDRHGFKNLNIAQVDFELMKKQEDLERQARGLVQQREWLEKERLRIQKLQQQVAGANGATTTKELTDAYQKMDSLEKRYQTEMSKLVKENKEMQNRITELQNQKSVKTPVQITTGSRAAEDERLKAERKIIAIEKRHAAERAQLIADNSRMQEQIANLQTAQKAEAEQARSKAVTAEEKQQAEAHIREMEKRHAAERAQLIAENSRMQEKMAALQQAQETAAALAKEKTATDAERRAAESKLAELQKQHEAERQLLSANNKKLQDYLSKLETEKQQEIAKLRTEMEREAATKAAAAKQAEMQAAAARMASLKQQHDAEQQKLLEENEKMQARLASLQQAQQEEAARARNAAKTAEELTAAEQRIAALQKQHEDERMKLMRENLQMQERLAGLQQAQQKAALAAKQADQGVLAEKARLEKELAALRTQHEAERQKLIRENAAVQQRLAAAEQEKQKIAQDTAARVAAQETKYAAELAAARAAREKIEHVNKRYTGRDNDIASAAMTHIEPQAGGNAKPSLVVKEISAEDLAALERSYNPGAKPTQTPHQSQNNWANSLPAPVTTETARMQAQQGGQYIPDYEPQAPADNTPENTVTAMEPAVSTHMPYAAASGNMQAQAAPVAAEPAPDAYRNFLDGIMAVHRGERPATALDVPTPSSVLAEREKRANEAAQVAAEMMQMQQQQQTTIYAEHPVIQQQQQPQPQYHDLTAPSAHMPMQTKQTVQTQVLAAPAPVQQKAAPLPSYGSTATAEQPLSALLKKSGIAPENPQLSEDGYMLKWSAGVANGLFEQQAWPQYKNANLRDLAARYVSRYNQDCENKLRVLSDKTVSDSIQSVHTLCPVQGNNYEAVFVFYAVPQHSFSAIVHVAQPVYSRDLQTLTAGLVPALQSLSGAAVKIDHIPAQLSHSQEPILIQ
ncbi:MAG: hypothetical protein HND56_00885 [Pseudomonadota bacterium]|nr:hypothetical protein [Pseudomonadota bacterium]QKK04322.1 MAG: hypothetical protein HND56_00885 [Pseudomonadota bacterium]